MSLKEKLNKHTLVLLVSAAAWICVVNVLVHELGIPYGWTLFFASIFFFLADANPQKLKDIFLGGTAGLVLAYLLSLTVAALAPSLGSSWALYVPLFIILFLLIVGGPVLPLFFNNYAFAYFTIALIQHGAIVPGIINSLLVFWLGGAVIMGGLFAIMKLAGRPKEEEGVVKEAE